MSFLIYDVALDAERPLTHADLTWLKWGNSQLGKLLDAARQDHESGREGEKVKDALSKFEWDHAAIVAQQQALD